MPPDCSRALCINTLGGGDHVIESRWVFWDEIWKGYLLLSVFKEENNFKSTLRWLLLNVYLLFSLYELSDHMEACLQRITKEIS